MPFIYILVALLVCGAAVDFPVTENEQQCIAKSHPAFLRSCSKIYNASAQRSSNG